MSESRAFTLKDRPAGGATFFIALYGEAAQPAMRSSNVREGAVITHERFAEA